MVVSPVNSPALTSPIVAPVKVKNPKNNFIIKFNQWDEISDEEKNVLVKNDPEFLRKWVNNLPTLSSVI